MRTSKKRLGVLSQLATLPFIAIAIFLLIRSASGYGATNQSLSKSTVQDIVETYAIQCYASEGSYPPDIQYLVDHYGLILDEERFIYEYDIFASNVKPEIIILDTIHGNEAP